MYKMYVQEHLIEKAKKGMLPIIAVDFDDTIKVSDADWKNMNLPTLPWAKEIIQLLYECGCEFILNTCRFGEDLNVAKVYLMTAGIVQCFSKFNENSDKLDENLRKCRKIYCNFDIDDRSIGGLLSWPEIFMYIYHSWLIYLPKNDNIERAYTYVEEIIMGSRLPEGFR